MKKLKAGELAENAQIGFTAIRYYEKRGILPNPSKSSTGYRLYSEEDVARVKLIKKMQKLGFSLNEIKRLFLDQSTVKEECTSVERRLKTKIKEVEKKISELEEMKLKLLEILKGCHTNTKKECCPLLHEQ